MQTQRIETLPEQLRSRILAATAHASHRRTRRLDPPGEVAAAYAVEAVSGDRVTRMRLVLRPDESVDEDTDSFTARDIVRLDREACELTIQGPEGTRTVTVSPDAVEAVRAMRA